MATLYHDTKINLTQTHTQRERHKQILTSVINNSKNFITPRYTPAFFFIFIIVFSRRGDSLTTVFLSLFFSRAYKTCYQGEDSMAFEGNNEGVKARQGNGRG